LLVDERTPLFARTEAGVIEINVDGTERRVIAGRGFEVVAVSADGGVIAFTDAVHGVWIARGGRAPVRIEALRGRFGVGAMSADGSLLVVGAWEWATASDSNRSGAEDDRLFVVDTRTLAVDVMPRRTARRIEDVAFSNDGSTIWLRLSGDFAQRVDVGRRERDSVLAWAHEPVYTGRPDTSALRVCPLTGERLETSAAGESGGVALDITSAELGRRRFVQMKGNPEAGITNAFFTPSCRHAVFEFDRRVWVADVETGRIGMLAKASSPFGLPVVEPATTRPLKEEGELHRHEWTADEVPESEGSRVALTGHAYAGFFYGPVALTRVRSGNERSGGTWVAVGMSGALEQRDDSILRTFDFDASLGTGALGLDGILSFDTVSAYRMLPSAWSPYAGIGLAGFFRGNDAYTHSELTLPEGRVGVHLSHDLGVVDLGAGIAPVLVGRFTTDAGRAKLGGTPRLGAYATLGYDWAFFRGGLTRVLVGDTPVTSADTHLCVNPFDLVLCATAHTVYRPLAQGGFTDATAVGLSLGFGKVL
jgi:hypothetical protein